MDKTGEPKGRMMKNRCPHCGEMNNKVDINLSYYEGIGVKSIWNLYKCRACGERYEHKWGWVVGELVQVEIVKIGIMGNPYPPPKYPLREYNDLFETRQSFNLGKGGQMTEEYKTLFDGLDVP